MDAKFIKQDGKVYLWLSDRFLAYHAARVACGKRLGNYWGERRYGGSQIEIPLEKVEATRKQVMHIAESLEVTDLSNGSTLVLNPPFRGQGDYAFHFNYGTNYLVVLRPEQLHNEGVFLSEAIDEQWGYPLDAYGFKELQSISLPEGYRARVTSSSLEEIQEEYNTVFKCRYEVLNLETEEVVHVMDLRTWLPAPNSGYIIKGGDYHLILASCPFLNKHLGKKLGDEIITSWWGWPAEKQSIAHGYGVILKAGWRGWFLLGGVGECVEEFNKPMMEALDVVTGETRCFTNDWTPDYTGGFILSHPDASDSLILAHQDWLEENTGRVLVNPVHRMWGWSLPAGISDWSYSVLEGLPDGWRGWWVPKMDVPEIVKQFNSIEVEVIL